MTLHRLAVSCLAASALAASPLIAQTPGSGRVAVTVQGEAGPLADVLVRAESTTVQGTTDAGGRVTLVLPAGRRTLIVAKVGFASKRVGIMVVADAETPVHVTLAEEEIELEAMTVTSARTGRLAGVTPTRVEVIPPEEVDEKTQMSPGGIGMLLTESNGIRVQPTSASLGTGAVRIYGLPGQYTSMLADGLPLYGGASSALGPLSISPVDLSRVEIIKGSASAFYGAQALGGVINLISRPATGRSEILINQTTRAVTDGAAWLSHKFGEQAGLSLLASGTLQGEQDLDNDGWSDQAEMSRWSLRPRFTLGDQEGRSLFVTAGYGHDDRTGGTVEGGLAPDGSPFAEGLVSDRADIGVSGRLPVAEGESFALRAAYATNQRDRTFGPGPVESDQSTTGFLEVTFNSAETDRAGVIGVALQRDQYQNELNGAYDHDWWTPSLFVTAERDFWKWLTFSISARVDAHPSAGTRSSFRTAFLAHLGGGWTARLATGNGFAPGTAQIEETEGIGLRQVRPDADLLHERSSLGTLDIAGKVGPFELLFTGYSSRIQDQVQLANAADATNDGILRNAAGPTTIWGGEAIGIWRFLDGGSLIATYGYTTGTHTDAQDDARVDVTLTPRHRAGLDLMFERPGVYRVGIEAFYYGVQRLDDDPYRTESKPYVHGGLLAMRTLGRFEVVGNIENLFDVRQTDYEPLVRPTPSTGGNWTVDAWGPLTGIIGNVAVRVRW
jgi:outer membrane receptor for ferrienterochelin and colicins